MSAAGVLSKLWHAGITVGLTPNGENLIVPAGRLTPEQRAMALENKPELIQLLIDAHRTTERLLSAAMSVCDRHGDNDAARQEMRDQCLALPPHLQADLLEHFNGTKK